MLCYSITIHECDTQHYDPQYNIKCSFLVSFCSVSFMPSITIKTVKLSVITLNVIMLSVIMPNVMGPFGCAPYPFKSRNVRHGWKSLALKNTLAYLFEV